MQFQGAARDPLQHALPFILTDPNVTKSIIRYTLKELNPPTTEPGDTVPTPRSVLVLAAFSV